jgi:hypothetical protein
MDLGEHELGKSSSEIFRWLAFHRLRSPSLHKTFDFRFAILATRGGNFATRSLPWGSRRTSQRSK